MFNRVDSSNIQPSSLPYSSEQASQDKNKTITQLSEDLTLTPEQREKLAEEIKTLQQEQTPEINLKFSSKEFVQIKDENLQQETDLETSPEKINLAESGNESIQQDNKEDLFEEESDLISKELEARTNTKSEALEDQSKSEENQALGIAEEATEKEIDVAKEETATPHAKEDISTISLAVDEAIHSDVEMDTELHGHSTVLPPQTCAKMLQGVDRTVEKLKANVSHQITVEEEQVVIKKTGKTFEENKSTLILGIGVDGISISKRVQELNGILDQEKVQSPSESTHSINLERLFLAIVNDEHKQRKFHSLLQAGCDKYKACAYAKNYSVREEIVKETAQIRLKQAVVDNGSVDLTQEVLKDFAEGFFKEATEKGALIGQDGKPVKPSEEELKAWQKEFTESFISYLISENLVQNQKQDKESKPKEQITATLLSLPKRSSVEGDNARIINQEIARGIIKAAITSQSLIQDLLTQLRKHADVKRQEEQALQEFDAKLADIKTKQIKKEELNGYVLKADRTMRVLKHVIERREVALRRKEKIKVSINPEEPPLDIMDLTREKRPS